MIKTLIIIASLLVIFIAFNAFRLYRQNIKIPELGHNNGELKALPSTPNAISSQSDDPKKSVDPLKFKGDLNQSREALKVAVYNLGFVELIKEENNYLYFVFTTKGLKFKDDVEFYFDDTQKVIHVRSSSRAGVSDMGVNLKRYQAIKELYNK